jgi:FtsP/CotA-like multicopper oxidase with cupredoxin domain
MSVHPSTPPSRALCLAALALCTSFSQAEDKMAAPAAMAKPHKLLLDLLKAPPLLKERDTAPATRDAANQPAANTLTRAAQSEGRKTGREIEYDMLIAYGKGNIYNPATGKHDPVWLRSYNGQFVAPTVVMKPGQTVRFNLMNQLPAEDPACTYIDPKTPRDPNTPQPTNKHCFNITNLHSHGLWVSPSGNSDNVLLSLNPGVNFEYEYNVPIDHPAGTFWYHPHKHGSTAMQVASGMSGALVIKGNRYPTQDSNGDLDTLLKSFEPKGGVHEEVMLLQQVPYACFTDKDKTTINTDPKTGRWVCDDKQVGEVENFNSQVGNFQAWGQSGRYTLINGQARPQMNLTAGKVYRWRMIDAGFNETVQLRVRKVVDPLKLNALAGSSEERAAEVAGACIGTDVQQFEVATDGLTRGQIAATTTTTLQPGYRSDILFALPEKGTYCVYDDASGAGGSLTAAAENPKVLAIIEAVGTAKINDQTQFMTEQLIKAAQNQPKSVRAQITADLKDSLKLTKFVPHPTITEAELKASNQPVIPIVFNLIGGPSPQFLINDKAYDGSRIDQTLILGTAQTWKLSSLNVAHPFHIHVNPFQIVSITSKNGLPLDPQYKNLVGTWKDTILASPNVDIVINTRYERYIGEYVLHCHILEHEDQGMMQNVQVVLPDGKGGAAKAHK